MSGDVVKKLFGWRLGVLGFLMIFFFLISLFFFFLINLFGFSDRIGIGRELIFSSFALAISFGMMWISVNALSIKKKKRKKKP